MPLKLVLKSLICAGLVLVFSQCTLANMAEPIERGTLVSNPFLNKHVEVIQETIDIWLGNDYTKANYKITYSIDVDKAGLNIPFLFYAMEYNSGIKVIVDGQEVNVLQTPDYLLELDDSMFSDFDVLYSAEHYDLESKLNDVDDGNFYVKAEDMHYFLCNLDQGPHKIEVMYAASVWADKWAWIKKYSFRYALAPAKYWKSFGTLHIRLKSDAFPFILSSTLGKPDSGSLNSIASWNFDTLPSDVLRFDFQPEINPLLKSAHKIGGFNLALFIGLILFVFHFLAVKKQVDNNNNKHNRIIILGSLLLPLIFVLLWWSSFWVFDALAAEHGSGASGYTFIILLSYPIIAAVYMLILWIITALYIRKLKR